MAMLKFAEANVVQPRISRTGWAKIRTAGRAFTKHARPPKTAHLDLSTAPGNLVDRATDIFGSNFDPDKYLLTHATIVASVDTYEPQGMRLGRHLENGFRVNRKFGNYRVKPACDRYINNNLDCWSRGTLLKAFQTFIGGHNFVEHVQIEEQSKGRIIDAVARDIGDSVYIDILIATDRKHKELVEAIESGKMGTLSMGCTVDGTICTKCGHWAADETEMCHHIKYEKGSSFYDEMGRRHRVAELCGHESIEPTGGVHFIEASWVETPAFTGAVMRNVLTAIPAEIHRQAEHVLNNPPPEWDAKAPQKAASMHRTQVACGPTQRVADMGEGLPDDEDTFLAGWDDAGGETEGEGEAPAAEPQKSPLQDAQDELTQHLVNQVTKKVKDDMKQRDVGDALGQSTDPNDTLQVEATARIYRAGLEQIVRTASSDAALMNGVAELNRAADLRIPREVYLAALHAGAEDRYGSTVEFLEVCASALGRKPVRAEARTLIRLGRLISQRAQARRGYNPVGTAVMETKQGVSR